MGGALGFGTGKGNMAGEQEAVKVGIDMETRSPRDATVWQADHCIRNDAPVTGRVVRATLPLLDGPTQCGQRLANWPGLTAEDALPLRIAGGLHHLHLTGGDPRLGPIYSGTIVDQDEIDRIIAAVVGDHDARLSAWLDGPPQTNEAGRSSSIVAALLWLAERVGNRFELLEIGASAGANTMLDRYAYDLGGTRVGPHEASVRIVPEWRGPPPPAGRIEIVSIEGCDQAPVDLTDPAQAMRLKSYCWPENTLRMQRLEAVIAQANLKQPRLTRADAADWIEARLLEAQEPGTCRVLFHSIVWQYIPLAGRERIEAAMAQAASRASPDRPLAWIMLETNRKTFRHELRLRWWPGGPADWTLLGEAHAHGAWVEWYGL
jgi:hypothetical protein